MIDNSVIEKIKKLLALANDRGAFEGETQNAMQKAHALLADHNLSMDSVKDSREAAADPEIGETRFDVDSRYQWVSWVWLNTCKLYFCDLFTINHRAGGRIAKSERVVVGAQHNIEIALSMGSYFIESIKRIADRECQGMGRAYKNSFLQGCALRLCKRIKDRIEQSKKGESVTDDGLKLPALLSLYEKTEGQIGKYMADTFGGVGKPKKSRFTISNGAGYRAGQSAGDSIPIDGRALGSAS